MPIPILCPCSAKLRVLDALAGLEVQCPKCQSIHPVPGEAPTNGRTEHATPPPNGKQILKESGFSAEERERLEVELEKGERLVWAAKPVARSAFHLGLVVTGFCCVVALMLLGVAIVTFVQKASAVVGVVLIVLALAAIAAGVTLPFVNRKRYERTAYALTDRRALVWDCDWLAKPRFKDYGPEDLASYTKMQFSQRADAVGHFLFAREVVRRIGAHKITRSHGFFYVTDVPRLEKLLRETLLDEYTDSLMK